MNKTELIDAVAEDSGLSKADSARAIDSLTGTVSKSLKKGEEVSITGFGKFSVVKRAARRGVNPRTGERVKSKLPRLRSSPRVRRSSRPSTRRNRSAGG
jgi:DNA-binding protein HU-beta